MAIPSSTYTEIVSTTIDNYRSSMADNVLNHNALLERMKRKGNTSSVSGGVKILENLMYAENSTVKWYTGLETLDVSQSDVLSSANFDWKELNVNIVMSGLEMAQNSGSKETMHNLMRSRISVAEKTLANTLGSGVFADGTGYSGKEIGGLALLVALDPTSGTVGGIDRSAETWWRNQIYDFSANSATPGSDTIQAAMNNVYINTMRGKDHVDMFVGGSTYFTYYLESLQSNQRFTDDVGETAGAGFRSLKFWGGAADVFYDENCTADRMYALNTDYIHFRPHSNYNFTRGDERKSVNQDGLVIPLFWKGNMTLSNGSLQAVIQP